MHQGVLHVLFDFGYHVDVIDKEPVKKVLGNVASIGNEFAKKILGECSVFQRFSVITIARCDLIVGDLCTAISVFCLLIHCIIGSYFVYLSIKNSIIFLPWHTNPRIPMSM